MWPSRLQSGLTKDQIIERYGEWTAMSIHLGGDDYTLRPAVDWRLSRLVQIVEDVARKPLHELRVLDLACLEGHYGIEFARHGAKVVGIEIREANLAKARYAAEQLGLSNIEFFQDDVRNLSREKYGVFDVVICSGILYHLTVPDVFEFVKRIHDVCEHLAIIDTQVALYDRMSAEFLGNTYWGLWYREHEESSDANKKAKDLWASIDNTRSMWITVPSLRNLMNEIGFTSFYECFNPNMDGVPQDRKTYVAIKGRRARLLTSPITDVANWPRIPEHEPLRVHEVQFQRPVRAFFKRVLPQPVKNVVKYILRSLRLMEPDPTPEWSKRE
jgi:hypothetical protein